MIANPVGAFSGRERRRTVQNIYSFLNAWTKSRNQYDVWDKGALVAAFGPDVADRAEEALRSGWRSTRPEAWSARAAAVRNQVPGHWILGLMGLAAEATTAGWSAGLSPDDVETAIAYAMIELNGFAPFLGDLVQSHPGQVARVIGSEVAAELAKAEDHEHLPVLQDLTYADPPLQRLCAPHLVDCLMKWPSVDAGNAERRSRFLDQALRIAGKVEEQATRDMLAKECAARYREDPNAAPAVVWLKGLFRFDPEQGVRQLVEEHEAGASTDPEVGGRMITAFGVVFGDDDPVDPSVSEPAGDARLLASLVRLAHVYVRPEGDQVHEDVYTPDTRDNAERARRMLFERLCDAPGPDARRALLELAEDEGFADMRDRLSLLARERAALDAEFRPFDSEAVVALGERYEAPPNDGRGLFAVMMDRLEDLDHDLAHGDFSDRRTVRSIEEETELQRTLARRLKERANRAYRVVREDEVADAKRPDVRLATVRGGDARVVMEVKIADKWTFKELAQALRKQLVGQYLRHEDCADGCLLLAYRGCKKWWVHPESGKHLRFSEVVRALRDRARKLETEHQDRIRVGVFGLDLTDRQPESD